MEACFRHKIESEKKNEIWPFIPELWVYFSKFRFFWHITFSKYKLGINCAEL